MSLVDAVIRVLSTPPSCTEEGLPGRLIDAGVMHRDEDLDVAIERLVDSGRLQTPRPCPTEVQPRTRV